MLNLLGLQFSRRRFDHIHDFISVRQWVIVEYREAVKTLVEM